MNGFAPVLIPTLNRFEHFKNCIESLSVNPEATFTDLFVAFDYPLKDEHWNGYRNIEKYLADLRGFKSVHIIKRTINFGAAKNLFDAISMILSHYDRLILSEDDNVFSVDFLKFLNTGLDIYKDRADIFSVSGYNYPIEIPKTYPKDVYLWCGFSAWGVGIWGNKWNKVDFSEVVALKNVMSFLKNPNDVIKLNRIANHYIPALLHMLKQNRLHGDGYICMYLYINNTYSIFPTVSRVRNMGNDGSGINCNKLEQDIYKDQKIYSGTGTIELPDDIKPVIDINRLLKAHFKKSFISKVKIAVRLFIMKIGFYKPLK
jgi:hypothetical protein